jgi:pimeloyl-ACP methyl ester carboxylesterase
MARKAGQTRSRPHAHGVEQERHAKPKDRLRDALLRWISRENLVNSPPLWREGRWLRELSALRLPSALSGVEVPAGQGRPVLLIPGYLAGDSSMLPMAGWLRSAGYRAASAGMRLNADCPGRAMVSLEARLAEHVASSGEPALIIGQSRGGLFGRLLARRRPDLVAGLITLGTPLLNPLGVHPFVLLNVGVVGVLGSLGVPGLFSVQCWRNGPCCGPMWGEIGTPLGSSFLSIYSRSDGIVDWRTCLDPEARHADVDSSHLGMAVNPEVYRLIAQELRECWGPQRPESPPQARDAGSAPEAPSTVVG